MEVAIKEPEQLIEDGLNTSISYRAYNEMVQGLVKEGKTSGESQHEDLVYYTKLNAQRAKRLNKTTKLDPQSEAIVLSLKEKYTWLVLTESWCGDAAQILPLLNKLAEASPNIELRLVLRDENLELMDTFLTNCGRSIPKLIMLNSDGEVVGTWGPRPVEAQNFYDAWKNSADKPPYKEFQAELQKWYLYDKGLSTFREVTDILKTLN